LHKWPFFVYPTNIQNDLKKLKNIIINLPKPIVFTNGVFDILHIGHIKYLQESKKLGSSLVVGVNSDESTKLLNKGAERPINPYEERAKVIASLKMVDLSIIFREQTPLSLIDFVMPQIYTKGNDYNLQTIEYSDHLKSKGIKIKFIPLIKDKSSTNVLKKLIYNSKF
jgi:D-glycero-beta-D-manno-heptose 1-phosphate adenylyltransferase